MATTEGKHLIVELLGCNFDLLNSVENTEEILISAAKKINTTVLNSYFHRFQPQGVTGVVVIEESHLSAHNWPESGYSAIDIFTCGKTDPRECLSILKEGFKATKICCAMMNRGKYVVEGSTKIDLETLYQLGGE